MPHGTPVISTNQTQFLQYDIERLVAPPGVKKSLAPHSL
jgi:hypothetical protein